MTLLMSWIVTVQIVEVSIHDNHYIKHATSVFLVFLKDIALFLTMYYLFKKASKPLEDKEAWHRCVKCIFYTIQPINVLIIVHLVYMMNQDNIFDEKESV